MLMADFYKKGIQKFVHPLFTHISASIMVEAILKNSLSDEECDNYINRFWV